MASEVRILCVGTGNPLTSPGPMRRENGRAYRYAPPGKLFRHGGAATSPDVSDLAPDKLISAYPGGPEIQGWGLIVVEDTFSEVLKTPAEVMGVQQSAEWETKIITAKDRANDMMSRWAAGFPSQNYGALIIRGPLPTAEELETAREARKASALEHLNEAINDQTLSRQGHKAYKRGYSPADRAWAKEYGMELPETVDSMKRIATEEERIPCPICAEGIMPTALKCRYCGSDLTAPQAEPKRGPGRPRKEEFTNLEA